MPAEKPHRRLMLTPPTADPDPGEQHALSPFDDEERTERDFPIELPIDPARIAAWEAQIARLADSVERLTATVERLTAAQRVAVTHTYRVEASAVRQCFPTPRVGTFRKEREVVVVSSSASSSGSETHDSDSRPDEAATPDQTDPPSGTVGNVVPPALDRLFIQVRNTSA